MIIRVMSDNKVLVIQDIGRSITEAEFIAKNSMDNFGNFYKSIDRLPSSEFGNYKLDGDDVVVDTDAEVIAKNLAEQEETNANHRIYLKETDWYIIRKTETGVDVPADILTKRAESRSVVQ